MPAQNANVKQPTALDRTVTVARADSSRSQHFKNTEAPLWRFGGALATCRHTKRKGGHCFLPGALKEDGRRANRLMSTIELLPYDLDTGHPIERLLMALGLFGFEAWVYATYKHEKPESIVPGGVAERWARLPPGTPASPAQVLDYLRDGKGYAPAVLEGASVRRAEKGFEWIVSHQPMGRYRLVVPLSRAVAMTELGATPDAAIQAYKALYADVASFLTIEHYDRSCADPARVSYAHSRPEGTTPFFHRIEGLLLDPDRFIARARERKAKEDAEHGTRGLARWFAERGDGFRAADFLADYAENAKPNANGGVEAVCPLQDQHSDGGDGRATCYGYNPAASQTGHPVIGCNHASCSALKMTAFVDALLQRHGSGVEALGGYTDGEDVLREGKHKLTHHKLALRFSEQHADDLRYVAVWGKWLLWDGHRWRLDETFAARDKVRKVLSREATRQENTAAVSQIESKWAIWAVEALAQSDRRHAATVDVWDRDPWLLGTPGGTVDLRTGELRPARREDGITKATAVAPAARADCPRWLEFLDQVFAGDRELIEYVRRLLGYCLTGSVDEHVLAFCHGNGRNGKGTLLGTLRDIMGDYGQEAPEHFLEESKHERHPTEIARLCGARVVLAQETRDGSRWNETRLKRLTGGDRLTAHYMRRDDFEFTPQFKLLVSGNSKPALGDVDEAMRRRLHLIPFNVTFVEGKNRVNGMGGLLKVEWAGILRWAIEGCLLWQTIGLAAPKAVRDATAAYLNEQDVIGAFLAECCSLDDREESEESSQLFNRFTAWVQDKGKRPLTHTAFSLRLQQRGLMHGKHPRTRRVVIKGVKLLPLPGFFPS